MSVQVDEATVRQFIEIISAHVRQAINGPGPPGVLQICRINPIDESVVPSRFMLDDVENMVKTAIGDATAGHNVYQRAGAREDGCTSREQGALGLLDGARQLTVHKPDGRQHTSRRGRCPCSSPGL
jgi:hypothetical protein